MATGIEALRIANPRGSVTVLPFMGQMIWRASFDGVELAMQSMFDRPRPAGTIVETYGCLACHAGLLHDGAPTAEDTHPLHGEFPCIAMDEAGLGCGEDERGAFLAVTGMRDYAMGFGAHHRATPRVVLREDATSLEMERLGEPERQDPEQVFYIERLEPASDGLVRFLLQRPEGDGFTVAYDPASMPHTIRWVLAA